VLSVETSTGGTESTRLAECLVVADARHIISNRRRRRCWKRCCETLTD